MIVSNNLAHGAVSLPLMMILLHLFVEKYSKIQRTIQVLGALIFLSFAICFLLMYKAPVTIAVSNWQPPFAITLVFDRLTCFMLVVFAAVLNCVSFFSMGDPAIKRKKREFYCAFWLLTLGMVGAISTHDLFNLYVWLEVMLVSSLILILSNHEQPLSELFHYALINVFGTLLMLASIGLIYSLTGTLNYYEIAKQISTLPAYYAAPPLGLLIFALGIKGGIFPLYFWLPRAYPSTSISSCMLMASITTKVIMVVLLRLVYLLQPLQSDVFQTLLIPIACATMVFGVLGAATQINIRRILSFHIISQLGYVLFSIMLVTKASLVAAIYFLVHNIFVKTNLFMSCGLVEQRYATNDLNKLQRLATKNNLYSIIFFLAATSLAGFPPFSGFIGKFLIISAAVDNAFYAGIAFMIAVSLFTMYSMFKIWRYGFCEKSEHLETVALPGTVSRSQVFAFIALCLIWLSIGMWPDPILKQLNLVAHDIIQLQVTVT